MSTNSLLQNNSEIIDFFTKIFPKGVVFFDLETTGLSPLCDRVIEFAGIKIYKGGVKQLQFLTDPEVEILPENEKIHGISNQMVKGQLNQKLASEKIREFIGETNLVAHNALFDFGFLLTLFHRFESEPNKNKIYCSCKLSRKLNKTLSSHKLSSLSESFNIELKNHHRAMDDTLACLKIFYRTLKAQLNPEKSFEFGFLFNSNDFKKEKIRHLSLKESLKDLPELVREKKIFSLKYSGGTKKNEFRSVQGVSLLPRPNGPVLYAFCQETKLYKYYKLNKIKEVKL
jgi:DNA polymerase III subunit epsilon